MVTLGITVTLTVFTSVLLFFVKYPDDDVIENFNDSASKKVVAYVNTVDTLDPSIKKRHHYLIGSLQYTAEIWRFDQRYGPRKAFSILMSDVNLYGKELDKNSVKNIDRFHKQISQLVDEIGVVDPEMHYFRNRLNRAPKTLNELIKYNARMPAKKRWYLLSTDNSLYHMQGENGAFHVKFNSYDGYCEAVYDRSGKLLNEETDPVNMGTFNYAAGLKSPTAHTKYDVSPYLLYGNTMNSPQKGIESINKGVRLAQMNFKAHRDEVFQFRNKWFGMQSGRVK